MQKLALLQAPHPALRSKAEPVSSFDDQLKSECQRMLDILYEEKGIGIGANMVGLLKRIIVVDLQEEGIRKPLTCINPKLKEASADMVEREEASLCFPGIRAAIKRPETITIEYQDIEGKAHSLTADGWLSTVIQHEMEYLEGRTFLDNLSKMQRDRLMKKMQKNQKQMQCCNDPRCESNH